MGGSVDLDDDGDGDGVAGSEGRDGTDESWGGDERSNGDGEGADEEDCKNSDIGEISHSKSL